MEDALLTYQHELSRNTSLKQKYARVLKKVPELRTKTTLLKTKHGALLDLYKKCTLRLKDVTKNQMEQEKTVIFESKRRQELQKEVQTLKDDLSTQYALSHRLESKEKQLNQDLEKHSKTHVKLKGQIEQLEKRKSNLSADCLILREKNEQMESELQSHRATLDNTLLEFKMKTYACETYRESGQMDIERAQLCLENTRKQCELRQKMIHQVELDRREELQREQAELQQELELASMSLADTNSRTTVLQSNMKRIEKHSQVLDCVVSAVKNQTQQCENVIRDCQLEAQERFSHHPVQERLKEARELHESLYEQKTEAYGKAERQGSLRLEYGAELSQLIRDTDTMQHEQGRVDHEIEACREARDVYSKETTAVELKLERQKEELQKAVAIQSEYEKRRQVQVERDETSRRESLKRLEESQMKLNLVETTWRVYQDLSLSQTKDYDAALEALDALKVKKDTVEQELRQECTTLERDCRDELEQLDIQLSNLKQRNHS